MSPASCLLATENTRQAIKAFTLSTLYLKSPVDEITVEFRFCRWKSEWFTGDSIITQLNVSFHTGDILHGDSKRNIRHGIFLKCNWHSSCSVGYFLWRILQQDPKTGCLAGGVQRDVGGVRYFEVGKRSDIRNCNRNPNLFTPAKQCHCTIKWRH